MLFSDKECYNKENIVLGGADMPRRKKLENISLEEQKDEIFSALIASGKTVEEVMTYLKSE